MSCWGFSALALSLISRRTCRREQRTSNTWTQVCRSAWNSRPSMVSKGPWRDFCLAILNMTWTCRHTLSMFSAPESVSLTGISDGPISRIVSHSSTFLTWRLYSQETAHGTPLRSKLISLPSNPGRSPRISSWTRGFCPVRVRSNFTSKILNSSSIAA